MQKLWKLLTSPRHLIVFEAAARQGSFTRAAEELSVQQPAVSAAIKQLETSLGVMLFERHHRRVDLTGAGQRLFADVSKALEGVLATAQSLHNLSQNDQVTLNASSAFNFYWMMPRLQAFSEVHPNIDLRLQSSDREPNIQTENINLAIRRGSGTWPGCHAVVIAKEVIYPVANPRVMASAINLKTVANLLNEKLIHLEEPIRERPSWKQWFAQFDVHGREPTSGLRLNDYTLVLQAAIAGEGFAFGWRHLTEPLIQQGLLAARREWSWQTGLSFYLVWSKHEPLSPQALQVRDWIVAAACAK